MQHIVTANDFCLGIGKQYESVAEFLRLPLIDLRRIDADTNDTDSSRFKIRQPSLKTPQLGVAERSPKAAVKNQRDRFRAGEQISQGNRLVVLIGQRELGRLLSDTRCSH